VKGDAVIYLCERKIMSLDNDGGEIVVCAGAKYMTSRIVKNLVRLQFAE
jgi:hypothetical protein